ncbi:5-formyltetrahydrofolate cyclo-ligase [Edwardsiella hoshinae]|uniref:5-formyltetrahydrofolate cyclo-ligase n=1 Tax=Edwardsiella hoshinae TaxID=93378 RepID=A0A376D9R5_9GAMM|nr:5-formyltetrahydrofolate cyclo-ligase [Edwardsiella hoshinae]AOV95924.1 5-formyltetrahydrofolate cyclo-ligase [Edwardsiella hoshinae]QPR28251.1 5-formyltetrahydrofolate cyclo-ligase [Edwardsiella hoshinae]STC84223.1 5-formyltetrahydrofolate cyclo-ligase family protein [Edwardsiella hoshinae]
MPQEPASLSRHHIRQQQRALRRSLSPAQQRHAAFALRDRLLAQPYLARPCRIALYLPFDGEPDTRPLIAALWQRGHQVVLPVLHPFTRGQLLFLRYTPETTMRRNAFGISEPDLDATRVVPLTRLDLMLTPLVAFDAAGNRLGMGGGFYDRTLAQWRQRRQHGFGPYPIGIAHDCQRVAALTAADWDVPLPEIVTPSAHYRWPQAGAPWQAVHASPSPG